MPPHVVGQQSFVIGRERRCNALFKCCTLARQQVDFKFFSVSEDVPARMAVTFGKLIDQLLEARVGLGDDFLPGLPASRSAFH